MNSYLTFVPAKPPCTPQVWRSGYWTVKPNVNWIEFQKHESSAITISINRIKSLKIIKSLTSSTAFRSQHKSACHQTRLKMLRICFQNNTHKYTMHTTTWSAWRCFCFFFTFPSVSPDRNRFVDGKEKTILISLFYSKLVLVQKWNKRLVCFTTNYVHKYWTVISSTRNNSIFLRLICDDHGHGLLWFLSKYFKKRGSINSQTLNNKKLHNVFLILKWYYCFIEAIKIIKKFRTSLSSDVQTVICSLFVWIRRKTK